MARLPAARLAGVTSEGCQLPATRQQPYAIRLLISELTPNGIVCISLEGADSLRRVSVGGKLKPSKGGRWKPDIKRSSSSFSLRPTLNDGSSKALIPTDVLRR